jgi:hypothetical protein
MKELSFVPKQRVCNLGIDKASYRKMPRGVERKDITTFNQYIRISQLRKQLLSK